MIRYFQDFLAFFRQNTTKREQIVSGLAVVTTICTVLFLSTTMTKEVFVLIALTVGISVSFLLVFYVVNGWVTITEVFVRYRRRN